MCIRDRTHTKFKSFGFPSLDSQAFFEPLKHSSIYTQTILYLYYYYENSGLFSKIYEFWSTRWKYELHRYLWERKLRAKLKYFATFGRKLLPVKLLPLAYYGESCVHGPGRMRSRDRLLFIEQRQQGSTPFTRHRETGQSDTQKYGDQGDDATLGAIRFQSKQGTP